MASIDVKTGQNTLSEAIIDSIPDNTKGQEMVDIPEVYTDPEDSAMKSNLDPQIGNSKSLGEQIGIAGQLLDLSMLFQIQDLGDIRLSNQESALLRKQLMDLPPEVALYYDSAQFSDICKLCSSILYRPLKKGENL